MEQSEEKKNTATCCWLCIQNINNKLVFNYNALAVFLSFIFIQTIARIIFVICHRSLHRRIAYGSQMLSHISTTSCSTVSRAFSVVPVFFCNSLHLQQLCSASNVVPIPIPVISWLCTPSMARRFAFFSLRMK